MAAKKLGSLFFFGGQDHQFLICSMVLEQIALRRRSVKFHRKKILRFCFLGPGGGGEFGRMVKEPRDSEVLVVKYVVIHLQWKLLSVAVVIGPFLRQLIMGVYVSWRLVAPVRPVFCLINNAQKWSVARFLCNWLSNWLLSSWGNCSRQYGKTHRLLHLQLRHLMAGVCSAHETLSYWHLPHLTVSFKSLSLFQDAFNQSPTPPI